MKRSSDWQARVRSTLLVLAVFWPWVHRPARGPTPTIEPLVVSLLCAAVIVALGAWGRFRVPRVLTACLAGSCIALLVADSAAGGGWSPAIAATWLALLGIAAVAAAGASMQADDNTPGLLAECLAWAWLAAGVVSCLMAFVQVAGFSESLNAWIAYSPQREAMANLRQRNHFATLAALALMALIWLRLHGKVAIGALPAQAMALLLCAGIAASASRMGAIELVLVLSLAFWWHRLEGRSARWLFAPFFAYAAAAVVLMLVFKGGGAYLGILRRLAEGVPDCPSRTVLWQNMAQLALERPWTGWGWGELPWAFYRGAFEPRFCALVDNAHNLPLHLAVELGIPFALVFTALCAWAVWHAKPWRRQDGSRLLAWGGLALLATHSMLEFPLWYGPFQLAFGLCLGILVANASAWRTPRAAGLAAASLLAGAGVYVAFDFHRVNQLYLPAAARSAHYREDTLAKARASWLFCDHVAFAELNGTPLIRENASRIYELAGRVMHFSPEFRVVEKRIQAAKLLGLDEEASKEEARYRAAWPEHHAAWVARTAGTRR